LDSTWPIFVVILVAIAIVARRFRRTLKANAHTDAIASLQQIDATSDADLSEGQRRAKRIPGRTQMPLETLEIIASAGQRQDPVTYWAAYEMIVRGLQITLDMQEMHQERGGSGIGGFDLISRPSVVSRMTYTTEAFIPHLRDIDSFDTFGRYAPFRSDRTIKLSIHPDDLPDAYALLRELGIRLSVMHHPDQHWWKDEP
jgi:hypothetical protein